MNQSLRIIDLMYSGGFIMWPLFIFLIATLVMFIRGLHSVLRNRVKEPSEITLLDFISHVAPILGFLGTVIGMISAFRSISAETMVHISIVAGGMYVALYTTAFGLIVALTATLAGFTLEFAGERVCGKETEG